MGGRDALDPVPRQTAGLEKTGDLFGAHLREGGDGVRLDPIVGARAFDAHGSVGATGEGAAEGDEALAVLGGGDLALELDRHTEGFADVAADIGRGALAAGGVVREDGAGKKSANGGGEEVAAVHGGFPSRWRRPEEARGG
jgi:hypothetical protein